MPLNPARMIDEQGGIQLKAKLIFKHYLDP